jgi:subtilisin family serine protease
VAIIDSGVLPSHPDLNVNRSLSESFVDDGFGPGPVYDGHGTHVAGIAGARVQYGGVMGMSPQAEIVDHRVFGPANDGGSIVSAGNAGDVVAAIVAAADKNCDVANLSLGFPPYVPGESFGGGPPGPIEQAPAGFIALTRTAHERAAQYALSKGMLPVASAGNSGVNMDATVPGYGTDPTVLPAEADGFVCVSATGPVGFGWGAPGVELPPYEPAVYTNYGPDAVDVSASGGNAAPPAQRQGTWFYDLVISTYTQPVGGGIEGGEIQPPATIEPTHAWLAGTSMSAPQVSGLAALMFSKNPGASPAQVREHIKATAKQLPVGQGGLTTAPGGSAPSETYRGAGHIDPVLAMSQPMGGSGGPGGSGGSGGSGGGGGSLGYVTGDDDEEDDGRNRRGGR